MLILHDPTQGIDVRAKLDIYRVIDDLSAQGIAILIISTEVRELVGVCDRILVMYEGRITRDSRGGTQILRRATFCWRSREAVMRDSRVDWVSLYWTGSSGW